MADPEEEQPNKRMKTVDTVEEKGKVPDDRNETMKIFVELIEEESRAPEKLAPEKVNQLFTMIFGSDVSPKILKRWSSQGIRFSMLQERKICLVQQEVGPSGIIAVIQAVFLNALLFFHGETKEMISTAARSTRSLEYWKELFDNISDVNKSKCLAVAMSTILLSCGIKESVVIATITTEDLKDLGTKALSSSELQKILRVKVHTNRFSIYYRLMDELHVFESPVGALLFLISALLSRGLDSIRNDRYSSLPLVSFPDGHLSQDVMNLLLTGEGVPNTFDGTLYRGVAPWKGITKRAAIGFLSSNGVGQNLKRPRYPIWVVGGNTHYTVLFALDESVQDEDAQGPPTMKYFDVFHINGGVKISKGIRVPRLCKISISALRNVGPSNETNWLATTPLINCIRTRWPGAICSWVGRPPVIDWKNYHVE